MERGVEVFCVIIGWLNDLTILCAYQLSVVDHSRALGDIVKTPYLRPTISLFEMSKAPISLKVGVAHYKKTGL